jgi:hypothetical protein
MVNGRKRVRNSLILDAKVLAWAAVRNKVNAGHFNKPEAACGHEDHKPDPKIFVVSPQSGDTTNQAAEKAQDTEMQRTTLSAGLELETEITSSLEMLLTPCQYDAKIGRGKGDEPVRRGHTNLIRDWTHETTGVTASNNKFLLTQKEALDVFSNKKKNPKHLISTKKRGAVARLSQYFSRRKTVVVHVQQR